MVLSQIEYQYIEKIEALMSNVHYLSQSYDYNDNWKKMKRASEYISLEEYELTGCDAIDLKQICYV